MNGIINFYKTVHTKYTKLAYTSQQQIKIPKKYWDLVQIYNEMSFQFY